MFIQLTLVSVHSWIEPLGEGTHLLELLIGEEILHSNVLHYVVMIAKTLLGLISCIFWLSRWLDSVNVILKARFHPEYIARHA